MGSQLQMYALRVQACTAALSCISAGFSIVYDFRLVSKRYLDHIF